MKLYRLSPITTDKQMQDAVACIHEACNRLCKKVMGEYLPNLGNIVIFCHYDDEYEFLKDKAEKLTVKDNNINNKYFVLKMPISIPTRSGIPGTTIKYLYIRPPDPYRSQTGDLDVYLEPKRYNSLKETLITGKTKPGMRIFPRGDLNMIELFDPDIDALTYVRPEML